MRKIFEGQLPLDDEATDKVIEDAFVVLDTNVLLDLYRYSKDTSSDFLNILESIQDDLWMPHHVGWEFLRRRATLRASATEKHEIRLKALNELQKAMGKTGGDESHVGGDTDEETFERALTSYIQRLKNHRKAIKDWATGAADDMLESILDLYEDRTGQAPSEVWYSEQQRIGKARYEQGTPPGYMDSSKPSNRFGDYYIWRQCIEHAKALQRPLIFVTGDSKEDWWEKLGNEVLGPHAELVQEFWNETRQRFILMNPTSFYDEFRPEPADEADSSTRDEIVATQASGQKRAGLYSFQVPDFIWSHAVTQALANLQMPKIDFDYGAIVRTAMAAQGLTQRDFELPTGDEDGDSDGYEPFDGTEEVDQEGLDETVDAPSNEGAGAQQVEEPENENPKDDQH